MKRGYDQSGASAVEFALILPLLVLFVFGIIQFGFAFSRVQGMEAAAREAARLASLGRDVQAVQVESAAHNAAPLFINSDHIDVFINDIPTSDSSSEEWCTDQGVQVTVRVEITPAQRDRYAIAIPLLNLGDPPSYEAVGVFRCERSHDD